MILQYIQNHKTPSTTGVAQQERTNVGMFSRWLGSDAVFLAGMLIFLVAQTFQGLEMSDEGFSAVFYQRIFGNPGSVSYCFMFWMSGVIGGIWYKLFGGLGLFGLRFAGALTLFATAWLTYGLLKPHLRRHSLKMGIFLAAVILNNDVKEVHYNTLSVLFFIASSALLYFGTLGNRSWLTILGGGVMGVTLFLRIPNLTLIGVIVVFAAWSWYFRKDWKQAARVIGFYAIGLALGIIGSFLLMQYLGHTKYYFDAWQIILNMSKGSQVKTEYTNSYESFKLVRQFISNNFRGPLSVLLVTFSLYYYFRAVNKFLSKSARQWASWLLPVALMAATLAVLFTAYLDQRHFIFYFYGLALFFTYLRFLHDLDRNPELLLLMGIGAYLAIVYEIGSSAGIITAGRYALWLSLPIAVDTLVSLGTKDYAIFGSKVSIHFSRISEGQSSLMRNTILGIAVVSGLYLCLRYPFSDLHERSELTAPLHNKNLSLIYTSPGRAKALDELFDASSRYVKPGSKVIAYDCLPMFYFATKTAPYLRNPQPWFNTSPMLEVDFATAAASDSRLPVVIRQNVKTIDDGGGWPERMAEGDYMAWGINQGRNAIMDKFLRDNEYHEAWTNHYFSIYLPGREVLAGR